MKQDLKSGIIEYIPEFIDRENANLYYQRLLNAIPWNQGEIILFGKKHLTPRLEAFYAENNQSYSYSNQQLITHPFTPLISELKEKIEKVTDFQFNSVLINLYRDGNDSNGWHADNEPELGPDPIIASLSFGTIRNFDLKNQLDGRKIRIPLENGSLLIMNGDIQKYWKHSIPKSKKINTPRINLTFRKII